MSITVFCDKLKQNLPALEKAPFPGPLGERIHQHISQEAWGLWVKQQTMLINEYRLNTLDPKARDFLKTQMQQFLFADESASPSCFVPPKEDN